MMKKMLTLTIALYTMINMTGCVAEEIEFSKSDSSEIMHVSEEENINDQIINEVPAKNNRPELGEKFYAYPFVKSGTLYATVTSAVYYNNINDAAIDENCFSNDVKEYQNNPQARLYDPDNGNILSDSADNSERVFVLVHITMKNEDAISVQTDYSAAMKAYDPILYADGYCDQYDFSANDFGIGITKKSNANPSDDTTGCGVDYFSLADNQYDDPGRRFLYHLGKNEEISFDIGKFLPVSVSNEEVLNWVGGEFGENLIARYCVVTSMSSANPVVMLQLE